MDLKLTITASATSTKEDGSSRLYYAWDLNDLSVKRLVDAGSADTVEQCEEEGQAAAQRYRQRQEQIQQRLDHLEQKPIEIDV